MIRFSARVELYPTEDPNAVRKALMNLFPESVITDGGSFLACVPENIDQLVALITEQKIRYAFIEQINRNTEGNRFRINLNKQAALAGRVNIADEPKPLGSIELSGETENPVLYFEKLLDILGYVSSRWENDESRLTQSADG
ncbi:MAG: hypothetical protein KIY09_08505 [Thermoplasmata archaeon]|nr:hypothetical protein [Candidatus Sysuiplasma acidicola]MDH2904777.1 RNA-binding domain-containing protein [Methanomassiliicoccales archaeon]